MNTREHTPTPTHTLVHSLSLTHIHHKHRVHHLILAKLSPNKSVWRRHPHLPLWRNVRFSSNSSDTFRTSFTARHVIPTSRHISNNEILSPLYSRPSFHPSPTPLQSLSQNAYQKTTVKKDTQKYRYKKVKESFQRPCFWLAGTNDVIWVWVWD